MRRCDGGWLVLIAALAATACGGDAEGRSSAVRGEAIAALGVIDTRTEHRALTATAFVEAEDGQPLEEGDRVRTDATGFAEVAYADGSLTRLDAETTFTVVALDGDVTVPEITVDLEEGRVWNRVNTVTGERGRFEVETAVGVAAVRGTAFAVACTLEPVCTFTVEQGLVVVTLLDGEQVEIGAGEIVTIGLEDGGEGGDGDAGAGGGSGGGTGTDGADGSNDGTDGGTGPDGTTSGDADTGGTSGATGTRRAVVLDRGTVPTGDGASSTGGEATTGTGAGVLTLAAWVDRNLPLDAGTGRFDQAAQESCSVTVNGRNLDHADSPDAAIEAPIEDALRVDAVATGELDRYQVDLRFAGIEVRAAEGEVLPDASGDRTTFRGDVDVARYARWGVGLYEVHATTTGTRCDATAFVNVTGRSPLATGTGIAALLLAVGGTAGLVAAINLATGSDTARVAGSTTVATDRTLSVGSDLSRHAGGTHTPVKGSDFSLSTGDESAGGTDSGSRSDSWFAKLTNLFKGG